MMVCQIQYLNISYVKVKHGILLVLKMELYNLNTSYVKVKRKNLSF